MQLMDKIMLDANINVLNVVTPLISNGVALSTPVKRATKQHPGTHHEHVMGIFMMMDFMAILCLIFFQLHHYFLLSCLLSLSKKHLIPPPSVIESSITPFFNNFYPPPILMKHHTWYLHDADLFISICGILYGIHQQQLEELILFREVLQHEQNHQIRTIPIHPIPFDILKKEIFLVLLYCGTTTLNYLTRKDWIDIKQLCIN
jgi:hypothetical protein